jgi:type IV pilus assembly protein PilB
MQNSLPVGQMLIENNLLNEEQLKQALAKQKEDPTKRIGDLIVEMGFVQEKDMLKILSKKLNVPYIENPVFAAEISAIHAVPEELLVKMKNVLPLYIRDNSLYIATSDPLDFYGLEDLRIASGMHIECLLAGKNDVEAARQKMLAKVNTNEAADILNTETAPQAIDTEDEEMNERIDSAPVVKLVNNIISEAIAANASDIHIEPYEDRVVVRFRVDGDLRENLVLQASAKPLLTTRLKIMSGMNIAEKRVPQDGRFKFPTGNGEIDMRVSSLPTIHGEKMVLRLLGVNRDVNYNFDDMGFSKKSIRVIRSLTKYSNGIILATGPTGSGKTTTLYAMLNEVIDPKLNIVTVEDPVEKRVNGINQVQVNTKAGLTFASGLRSILRQDPDIIMIGEIRDAETAEIAVRASITGHLVISTLHTNDSFSSIARLMDMGIEPYLLADSIRGVLAQRLIKRICPHCKAMRAATDDDRRLLNDNSLTEVAYGKGCQLCGNTGYAGRIAAVEIFKMNPDLKAAVISKGSDARALREIAAKTPDELVTMREEVLKLVKEGTTTVEEAIRILYSME